MCNNYNGWSNYPTWNIMLWSYGEGDLFAEISDDVLSSGGSLYDLRCALKNYMEELSPEVGGFYGDVMTWAISLVDWDEIATSLQADWLEFQKQ